MSNSRNLANFKPNASGLVGPEDLDLSSGTTTIATADITNLAYTGTLTGGTGVVNLGSGQVYKDASGNVGIGTSSPSAKLEVSGIVQANNGVYLDNTNLHYLYNGGAGKISIRLNDGASAAGFMWLKNFSAGVNGIGVPSGNLVLGTADLERMRIDSAGNVGIGTSSPSYRLAVVGSAGTTVAQFTDATNGTFRFTFASSENRIQDGGGQNLWVYDNSAQNSKFFTNNTERMRIDSVGNLVLGASAVGFAKSGSSKGIDLVGSTNSAEINLTRSGASSTGYLFIGANDEFQVGTSGAYALTFNTSNTERARIDSSGNLLVGTTSVNGDGISISPRASASGTTSSIVFVRASTTLTGNALVFFNGSTNVGTVSYSNTSTQYNTSSDYRLKEDVQPVANPVDRLKQLKPVNFAWKVDGSRVDGFLAHEAQEVVPAAVTGEKDAVDAEGNPEYQGIDQSKLVPLLTAALQEALAKIESLEARLDAANL